MKNKVYKTNSFASILKKLNSNLMLTYKVTNKLFAKYKYIYQFCGRFTIFMKHLNVVLVRAFVYPCTVEF